MARLRIGSRGSQLALWQAHHISDLLRAQGHTVELEIIKTTGDKITDVALAKVGTKGMFTKEIEEALLENRVDLAVHSLKDLPTELAADFDPGAFTFHAAYDPARGAVDSFLVSDRAQTVHIGGAEIAVPLEAGERIHTESSYKFTPDELIALAGSCGYQEERTFTDAAGRYALSLVRVR